MKLLHYAETQPYKAVEFLFNIVAIVIPLHDRRRCEYDMDACAFGWSVYHAIFKILESLS
jgi:hypothetical protein